MNLTTLKASAEQAKASSSELELWQMEISPDVVLRLVEVARVAKYFVEHRRMYLWPEPSMLERRLIDGVKGIEP